MVFDNRNHFIIKTISLTVYRLKNCGEESHHDSSLTHIELIYIHIRDDSFIKQHCLLHYLLTLHFYISLTLFPI